MRVLRAVAAAVSLVAVFSLTACTSSIPPEVLESRSAAMKSMKKPAVREPLLKDLQKLLDRAIDPNLPVKDKLDTIEGAENEPEMYEKITQAAKESQAKIVLSGQIIPIDPVTRTVHATMTVPGQPPQDGEIKFVYTKGKWKISKSYVCSTITLLMPDSVPKACEI